MNPFRQFFELPMDDVTVFQRMSKKTQLVKFGILNLVHVGSAGFRNEWLGNVDEKRQTFKLFRVKSPSHTSDFVLRGSVTFLPNKTSISALIYPQYSLLLGYAGILITVYFFSTKIEEFQHISAYTTFGISAFVITAIYTLLKFKDYSNTLKSFQELIDPKNDELEKRVYRD
jgi:multidrug transporter EmrE-like cation transporter